MAFDYGPTELGDVDNGTFLASARRPRSLDITIASGQGELAAGTLVQIDSESGEYEKWDGESTLAGILNEAIDATEESVKTYCLFDCDVDALKCFAGVTTISAGYHHESAINIKEAV